MARFLVPLMALLPHGCCVLALFTGYWGTAQRMECHGDPLLYPMLELSGMFLAGLCLLDLWKGGGGYPYRGLIGLCLLAFFSWAYGATVMNQIALSGLSKTGQGYLLFQLTGFVLRRCGLVSAAENCPFCPPAKTA